MTLFRRKRQKEYSRFLFVLLLSMATGFLLHHSLAGGTLLHPNLSDSYSLQAQNWLAGHMDIPDGADRAWLELAVFDGRFWLSFPPVPSVFLLPWVVAFGGAEHVPSNLVIGLWAMAGATGVFTLFRQKSASPKVCLFWGLLTAMGSNLWWMSTRGSVWFLAQVLNFALAAWGLVLAEGQGTARHTAAAFLLALAVGCRPFSILLLGLVLAGFLKNACAPDAKAPRRAAWPGAGFWLPVLAAALVGAALAGYNLARFGNPLEFGHRWLPEFQRAEAGQFSPVYFWSNLTQLFRPITLKDTLALNYPMFNGFLFFVANPVFLFWGIRLAARGRAGALTEFDWAALVCFGLNLAALCLHKTLGGWQFGARYTVDLIPFALLSECTAARPRLRLGAWTLCGLAVLFNLYGAVVLLPQ